MQSRLRQLRDRYNLYLNDVATLVGMNRLKLYRLELGKTVPTIKERESLARFYRVPVNVISKVVYQPQSKVKFKQPYSRKTKFKGGYHAP